MKGKLPPRIAVAASRKVYDAAMDLAERIRGAGRGGDHAATESSSGKRVAWIHACSVGEVGVALRLIEQLRRVQPDLDFVLSATTTDGYALATASGKAQVWQFPFDSPAAMRRLFNRAQPSFVVLIEAEIWPNHLREARRRNIPVFVVNGRITQGEHSRYRLAKWFLAEAFESLRLVGAATEADARRFRDLGAPEVKVLGNLKTDPPAGPSRDLPAGCSWLAGHDGPVVLGASTHRGEEEVLLVWLQKARAKRRIVLVLAPRHPSRARQLLSSAARLGLLAATTSATAGPCEVLLVDKIGELRAFYPQADICFVGKSLRARGGQNPWEPLQAGCATVFGPHMENFAEEAAEILRAGAALSVENVAGLRAALDHLTDDTASSEAMITAGCKLLAGKAPAAEDAASAITESLMARGHQVYPVAASC